MDRYTHSCNSFIKPKSKIYFTHCNFIYQSFIHSDLRTLSIYSLWSPDISFSISAQSSSGDSILLLLFFKNSFTGDSDTSPLRSFALKTSGSLKKKSRIRANNLNYESELSRSISSSSSFWSFGMSGGTHLMNLRDIALFISSGLTIPSNATEWMCGQSSESSPKFYTNLENPSLKSLDFNLLLSFEKVSTSFARYFFAKLSSSSRTAFV